MKIKVINSGSDGNAYVITDKSNHQLLLECGVVIKKIFLNCNLDSLEACVISHEHKDHSASQEKLEKYGIPTLSNFTIGKWERTKSFKILPMESFHNVKCFSFIIYSICEGKSILFITDSYAFDMNIPDIPYDLALLECNYQEKIVERLLSEGFEFHGYSNHMSKENLVKWLKSRHSKPKSLCLIHLSNSGLLDEHGLISSFKQYADKLYIAKANLEMEI